MKTRLLLIPVLALVLGLCLSCGGRKHVSSGAKSYRDLLVTQKGEEYTGELKSVNGGNVTFKSNQKGEMTLPVEQLERVDLGTFREGDDWDSVTAIDDSLLAWWVANAPTADKFPNSGYITLHDSYIIEVLDDSTATVTERVIQRIFKERGKSEASKSWSYFTGVEEYEVDWARTITPAGKIVTLNDAALEEASPLARYGSHNRLRSLKFAMPEAAEGAILDYQVTCRVKLHDALNPFLQTVVFGDAEPILDYRVELTYKPGVHVFYALQKNDVEEGLPTLDSTITRKMRTYRWQVRNTPVHARVPYIPPTSKIFPTLIISAGENWDVLGKTWLSKLAELGGLPPGAEKVVDSLVAAYPDTAKLAEAIYRYVAKEIKQIGLSYSSFRTWPKPPDSTWALRYGTDLDKNTLLYLMYRKVGIPCVLALGAGRGSSLSASVPSLGYFWQSVVGIREGKLYRWLSAQSDVYTFRQLDPNLQGSTLLVMDPESPYLAEIPLLPAEEEAELNDIEAQLTDEGTIRVEWIRRFTGSSEAAYRQKKESMREEIRKDFEAELSRRYPNATLQDYEFRGFKDLVEPVEVVFHFIIPDFMVKSGDKLATFHIPMVDYEAWGVGQQTRDLPLWFPSPKMRTTHVVITMPVGWQLDYLPKQYVAVDAGVSFEGSFTSQQDQVVYNDTYKRAAVLLPASKYDTFKKVIETQAGIAKEVVIVQRRTDAPPERKMRQP